MEGGQETRESDEGRRTSGRGMTVKCGAVQTRTEAQNGSSPDKSAVVVLAKGNLKLYCAILKNVSIAHLAKGNPKKTSLGIPFAEGAAIYKVLYNK